MMTRLVHRRRFAPYAKILQSEKSSLSEKQASTSYRKGKRKRIAPISVNNQSGEATATGMAGQDNSIFVTWLRQWGTTLIREHLT
jgi:hypothetical protein